MGKIKTDSYKVALHSFYVLRSELKFKGYELTLCDNRVGVVLKDLKTERTYGCNVYDTMWTTADEFVQILIPAETGNVSLKYNPPFTQEDFYLT